MEFKAFDVHGVQELEVAVQMDDGIQGVEKDLCAEGIGGLAVEVDDGVREGESDPLLGDQPSAHAEVGLEDEEFSIPFDLDMLPVEPDGDPFDLSELPEDEGLQVLRQEFDLAGAGSALAEADLALSLGQPKVVPAAGDRGAQSLHAQAAEDEVLQPQFERSHPAGLGPLRLGEEGETVGLEVACLDGDAAQVPLGGAEGISQVGPDADLGGLALELGADVAGGLGLEGAEFASSPEPQPSQQSQSPPHGSVNTLPLGIVV